METVVRVSPEEVTLSPGESQVIEVWVDYVAELWAFALEVIFDPAALTVSDLEAGEFLSTESGRYLIIVNAVDNTLGRISFDMTQKRVTDTDPLPRDGSGVLISFQVLAKSKPGETNLILNDVLLSNKDGEVIPASVVNGTVRIISDKNYVYLPLFWH